MCRVNPAGGGVLLQEERREEGGGSGDGVQGGILYFSVCPTRSQRPPPQPPPQPPPNRAKWTVAAGRRSRNRSTRLSPSPASTYTHTHSRPQEPATSTAKREPPFLPPSCRPCEKEKEQKKAGIISTRGGRNFSPGRPPLSSSPTVSIKERAALSCP